MLELKKHRHSPYLFGHIFVGESCCLYGTDPVSRDFEDENKINCERKRLRE